LSCRDEAVREWRLGENTAVSGTIGIPQTVAEGALDEIVRPLGYALVPVRLDGCLHLKSACCALDGDTLLVNRAWLEAGALPGVRLVDVPAQEPWGANVLPLPGAILVSAACPRTADLVCGLGHPAVALDVSELHKAEAGLTCMSLVFKRGANQSPAPHSRDVLQA
jgi:dimethylargininase